MAGLAQSIKVGAIVRQRRARRRQRSNLLERTLPDISRHRDGLGGKVAWFEVPLSALVMQAQVRAEARVRQLGGSKDQLRRGASKSSKCAPSRGL